MRTLNAWQWAILAILAVNVVASIAMIGKERKPITPGYVITGLIVNALLGFAVVMS